MRVSTPARPQKMNHTHVLLIIFEFIYSFPLGPLYICIIRISIWCKWVKRCCGREECCRFFSRMKKIALIAIKLLMLVCSKIPLKLKSTLLWVLTYYHTIRTKQKCSSVCVCKILEKEQLYNMSSSIQKATNQRQQNNSGAPPTTPPLLLLRLVILYYICMCALCIGIHVW